MNDKFDEPAKQPAEGSQPEAQEQPEYRDVSPDELKQILEAHQKWLESEGEEGQQADLRKADLRKADFMQANLRNAVLREANLEEANLLGADLTKVSLRDANLQEANALGAILEKADLRGANLNEAQLWTANLQNATLSEATLTRVRLGGARLQGADLTKVNLKGADLIDVKGLSEATLHNANLEDATGLLGSEFARADVTGTVLPKDIDEFKLLNVVEEISKNARKIFFSVLLGCAYAWLTIATTTDANLLTNSASSPLPIIGTKIPIAWFYVAAPLILVLFYLYLHFYLQRLWNGLATLPAIFPDGRPLDQRAYPWLLNSVVRRHFRRLQNRPPFAHLEEWVTIFLAWWAVPATLLGFWLRYLPRHDWWRTAFHVLLLTIVVWGAMVLYRVATSALRGGCRFSFGGTAMWLTPVVTAAIATLLSISAIESSRTSITRYVGYNTFADLREVDVSAKPTDYYKLTEQQKQESVKGANLRGRDLRGVDAVQAFMVNADLRSANLQGAELQGANLQGANLWHAQLQNASLYEASLQGANLTGANLQGANLRDTNLHRTSFYDASLQGANLYDAKLQGAQLSHAKLQGAQLSHAKLQGAQLKHANFQDAKGLVQKQLDGACGDEETKLPPGLSVKLCPDNSRQ
jgi:uncharacterized protein YjbI with pentapeptide repeats